MNQTNVSHVGGLDPKTVLAELARQLPDLSPQMRKAVTYIIENPNVIGISSIREMAESADVKPNTLMRVAHSCGYEGYDDFRAPFREEIRRGRSSFPDRARWLQSLSKGGEHSALFADMATTALENLEQTFAATNAEQVKAAADTIVTARRTYVLGVGINHTLARNFAYLADMALSNIKAIPQTGSLAVDDIAHANKDDVLVAMTFKPYRKEVVDAVNVARAQGVTIIGISDSPASPVLFNSEHGFVVQTDTPQFFTSTVATCALLETLMAFVIADADPGVVANIERVHTRRHQLGIYCPEPGQ